MAEITRKSCVALFSFHCGASKKINKAFFFQAIGNGLFNIDWKH